MIYTSAHMWNQVVGGDRTFGKHPLWVACWGCGSPILPAGWTSWRIWQDGAVRIPGIDGKLDGNALNGTDADVFKLLSTKPVIDDDATYTTTTSVTVDLAGSDGSSVRYSADGTLWTPWERRTAAGSYVLDPANGPQTVHVQLADRIGNMSPVASNTIVLDSEPPIVTPPGAEFQVGALRRGPDEAALRATWSAGDALSGVVNDQLHHDCGVEPVTTMVRAPSETALEIWLPASSRCQLGSVAADAAGNVSSTATGPSFELLEHQEASPAVAYGGTWRTASRPSFWAGTTRYTSAPGSAARLTFSGTDVAVVSTRGPDRGIVKIRLDGVLVDTVDLYAPTRSFAEVVFARNFPDSTAHVLKITVTGTRNPGSTSGRVDIDGFLTIQP